MKLHFKKYGENKKPLLILHGYLGSLDNWHTLAGQFSEDFTVYGIDLRNHGKSPHSVEFNFEVMMDDLLEFAGDHSLNSFHLLGHSMGGKIAMLFALNHPEKIEKLIVADIGPQAYPRGHDDVLAALNAVDLNKVENRKDAEEQMIPFMSDFGVRQFLLKNLAREDDGYKWKMNLPVLQEKYNEIRKEVTADKSFDKDVLFIRGGNSPYIREQDMEKIRSLFPKVKHEVIPGAGHWLHAENPKMFYEKVLSFLKN